MIEFKTIDLAGRVIIRDGKIYRLINDDYIDEMQEIIDVLYKYDFLDSDIVNTQISTDNLFTDYKLVLEHEKLDFVSYPTEWSPNMLLAASNFLLSFILKLHKIGLGLRDVHLFNLTFHQGKFVFLDFGALKKGKTGNWLIRDLIYWTINPFLLVNKKQWKKYKIFFENREKIIYKDISGYLSFFDKIKYYFLLIRVYIYSLLNMKSHAIERVKRYLNDFQLNENRTYWCDYYKQDVKVAYKNENSWNEKQKKIMQIVKEIKPTWVIDVGGNSGLYSLMISNYQINTICMDFDIGAIDKAYLNFCNYHKLIKGNIYPIVVDFVLPTLANHRGPCNKNIIPFGLSLEDRLPEADLTMLLAIVHHLCFFQNLTFEEIVCQVISFAKKYLLIEFPTRNYAPVKEWLTKQEYKSFDWYNISNFQRCLEKSFQILGRYDFESNNNIVKKGDLILYLCVRL